MTINIKKISKATSIVMSHMTKVNNIIINMSCILLIALSVFFSFIIKIITNPRKNNVADSLKLKEFELYKKIIPNIIRIIPMIVL